MEGCADSAPAHARALCVPDASLVTAVDRSTTLSETLGFLGALLPDLSALEPAVPIQPQLQTTTPLRHTPGATSAVLCPRPPPGGDPTLCELEVPRFPGLHVDVSVATGLDPAPFGEPEVPGHQDMGMPRADDDTAVPVTPTAHSVHDAPVDAADVGTLFIDSVRLPLQECLLQAPPCPRGQRREPENLIPRRSDRLAAKSAFREPNLEKQAKRVLVNKWEGRPDDAITNTPDDAIADKFHTVFGGPVSPRKRQAMRVLFHGTRQFVAGELEC